MVSRSQWALHKSTSALCFIKYPRHPTARAACEAAMAAPVAAPSEYCSFPPFRPSAERVFTPLLLASCQTCLRQMPQLIRSHLPALGTLRCLRAEDLAAPILTVVSSRSDTTRLRWPHRHRRKPDRRPRSSPRPRHLYRLRKRPRSLGQPDPPCGLLLCGLPGNLHSGVQSGVLTSESRRVSASSGTSPSYTPASLAIFCTSSSLASGSRSAPTW